MSLSNTIMILPTIVRLGVTVYILHSNKPSEIIMKPDPWTERRR